MNASSLKIGEADAGYHDGSSSTGCMYKHKVQYPHQSVTEGKHLDDRTNGTQKGRDGVECARVDRPRRDELAATRGSRVGLAWVDLFVERDAVASRVRQSRWLVVAVKYALSLIPMMIFLPTR